jgi:hypothetical protein
MPKLLYDFDTSDSAILTNFSDATSNAIRYEKVGLSRDHVPSSLKMIIDRHEYQDKVPHRSDLAPLNPDIQLGTEVEYRFKFRFPDNWVPDPIDGELFAQWLPSDRTTGGPCLAFYLYDNRCALRSNNPAISDRSRTLIESVLDYLQEKPPIQHRWTELSVRAKWSTGNDGSLIVSRDGAVIGTFNGQNCDSVTVSPRFKFGPYKPGWGADRTQITRRVVYFQYVSIEC